MGALLQGYWSGPRCINALQVRALYWTPSIAHMARITTLIDEDPDIIEVALRHRLQAETCKVIGELIVAFRSLDRPIDSAAGRIP